MGGCSSSSVAADVATARAQCEVDSEAVVESLMALIRERWLRREGLFRVPGNSEAIAEISRQLEAGEALDVDDPDVAASLLKKWLVREPSDEFFDFLAAVADEAEWNRMNASNLATVFAPLFVEDDIKTYADFHKLRPAIETFKLKIIDAQAKHLKPIAKVGSCRNIFSPTEAPTPAEDPEFGLPSNDDEEHAFPPPGFGGAFGGGVTARGSSSSSSSGQQDKKNDTTKKRQNHHQETEQSPDNFFQWQDEVASPRGGDGTASPDDEADDDLDQDERRQRKHPPPIVEDDDPDVELEAAGSFFLFSGISCGVCLSGDNSCYITTDSPSAKPK